MASIGLFDFHACLLPPLVPTCAVRGVFVIRIEILERHGAGLLKQFDMSLSVGLPAKLPVAGNEVGVGPVVERGQALKGRGSLFKSAQVIERNAERIPEPVRRIGFVPFDHADLGQRFGGMAPVAEQVAAKHGLPIVVWVQGLGALNAGLRQIVLASEEMNDTKQRMTEAVFPVELYGAAGNPKRFVLLFCYTKSRG